MKYLFKSDGFPDVDVGVGFIRWVVFAFLPVESFIWLDPSVHSLHTTQPVFGDLDTCTRCRIRVIGIVGSRYVPR